MTTDHTPWEVGLGFTVSKTKKGFRGRESLLAAKGREKIINVCLDIDHDDMLNGGETRHLGGKSVGLVNSPGHSHRLGKSLALAHSSPQGAAIGTRLQVIGDRIETGTIVTELPIYNPNKARTHR